MSIPPIRKCPIVGASLVHTRTVFLFSTKFPSDFFLTGFMSAHCTIVVALTQRKRSGASLGMHVNFKVGFFSVEKSLPLGPSACATLQIAHAFLAQEWKRRRRAAKHSRKVRLILRSGGVEEYSVRRPARHSKMHMHSSLMRGKRRRRAAKHSEMHAHFSEREGEEKIVVDSRELRYNPVICHG